MEGDPGLNKGLTFLVTRRVEDSRRWARALEVAGYNARILPCLALGALEDETIPARMAEGLEWADWVAFTSSKSVAFCPAVPDGCRIAAVGPHTAEACLQALGRVDLRPGGGRARALALELLALPEGLRPRRLLFPCAEGAMSDLGSILGDAGVRVRQIPVYRTGTVDGAESDAAVLAGVDYILLASPSAVRGLIHRLGGVPALPAISLGPATTRAAREAGLDVVGEAAERSLEGMIQAVPSERGG